LEESFRVTTNPTPPDKRMTRNSGSIVIRTKRQENSSIFYKLLVNSGQSHDERIVAQVFLRNTDFAVRSEFADAVLATYPAGCTPIPVASARTLATRVAA
jgi:hypothetical protein